MSMTRKCHNCKLQTNIQHHEEETQNTNSHLTSRRQFTLKFVQILKFCGTFKFVEPTVHANFKICGACMQTFKICGTCMQILKHMELACTFLKVVEFSCKFLSMLTYSAKIEDSIFHLSLHLHPYFMYVSI